MGSRGYVGIMEKKMETTICLGDVMPDFQQPDFDLVLRKPSLRLASRVIYDHETLSAPTWFLNPVSTCNIWDISKFENCSRSRVRDDSFL